MPVWKISPFFLFTQITSTNWVLLNPSSPILLIRGLNWVIPLSTCTCLWLYLYVWHNDTIEFSQKIAMLMCKWYKDLHSDFIFSNNPSLQYIGFLALIKFCQFPSTVIFDISVGELFNTTKRLAVVHAIGFVTKMSHFLSDKVFYTFYIM